MESEFELTRRRALQGMLGLTAATVLSSAASRRAFASEQATAVRPLDSAARLQSLALGWRFHRGDASGAEAVQFDDKAWRALDIPHDWSIEDLDGGSDEGRGAVWTNGVTPLRVGPFDRYASEGQEATGWTVGGVGWYRKTFTKPRVSPNGKVEIRFEGVYMNSDVWINGVHLGNHPYGYTEFAYDLTPHLKEGANVLAVRVNNAGRNSRWYSGSGIYRKVWLSNAGDVRMPLYGISLTAPEVTHDRATVQAEVAVESGLLAEAQVHVTVRLKDRNGRIVAEATTPLAVSSAARATAKLNLAVPKPRLWSPAEPYLYQAEVLVERNGAKADVVSISYGVRKVEIDAVNGLRINGDNIKLRGGCVHHDNGLLGSAAIPRAEDRRVELMKANGYNAIRTSHNPPSPAFLDACDRLGMLVIDEAFDCWEDAKNDDDYHKYFAQSWKSDLEAMILRDRNRPSVILWSIGNEIHERAEPHGVEIGKSLAQRVHELDPTRKVTAAICMPWDLAKKTWKDLQPAFTYLDVGGYNYGLSEYEKDHAGFPDRVMVGTESYPRQIAQNWNGVEKNSWVIGDFVWTAIDYLGESGIGHANLSKSSDKSPAGMPYPWFNAYCGDIDLIGNKKPQSYFRDVVWRRSAVEMAVQRPLPTDNKEVVNPWGWSDELRSWTWPGFEGKTLTVRVYTRGTRAVLYLNGKEIASKDLLESDHFKAEFEVPYAAGDLKAVAFDGDKQIGTISFTTVGQPHRILLRADRSELKAGRDDLAYVMAQVVDAQGRLVPDASLPISFAVRGAGELAAVGSANPKDMASFRQPKCRTFHGTCVAIVRPYSNAGPIELQASSEGLESCRIMIHALA